MQACIIRFYHKQEYTGAHIATDQVGQCRGFTACIQVQQNLKPMIKLKNLRETTAYKPEP